MRNKILLLVLTLLLSTLPFAAQAPEAGIKPTVIMGEIVSIDASKIVLKTKDGEIAAGISDKTEFKRVSPQNPSLKNAVTAASSDIGIGDKVVISGIMASDRRSLPARSVYLMTKSDIAQRYARENEEWKTRGITGRVTAVNAQTNQVTVEQRGLMGATTTITVTPKQQATFLRYSPNSIKYEEAVASSVADIKPGDTLRALGDRGADGTTFAAERIITGAFRTVGGTVKSVDAAKGEIVITDLQSKKDVTVTITPGSVLKKFPAEMAARMAAFQGGARPAGGPPAGPQPNAALGVRPGGAGRSGNIDDMIDRFPTITAADLKIGDMIAVSSSKNGEQDLITAIKLLAGIEPFVRAAPAAGGRPRGGQGGRGDFNIPGLEGFGSP